MTNRKVQTKFSNKLLFCKLCSYVAKDEAELNFHYKMAHEEDSDISEEFQIHFVSKKEYEKILQNDYLRICKSQACIIRKYINIEDDKQEIKRLYKEYCETCELKKYLLAELRQNGKI